MLILQARSGLPLIRIRTGMGFFHSRFSRAARAALTVTYGLTPMISITERKRTVAIDYADCKAVTPIMFTMSSTRAPRDRSFIGFFSPCRMGPMARPIPTRSAIL